MADTQEELDQLKAWIAEKLRPGIASLRQGMQQRMEELEKELETERKNRKEMEKWIEDNVGFGLEKVQTLIDKRVEERVKQEMAKLPVAAAPPSSTPSDTRGAATGRGRGGRGGRGRGGSGGSGAKQQRAPWERKQHGGDEDEEDDDGFWDNPKGSSADRERERERERERDRERERESARERERERERVRQQQQQQKEESARRARQEREREEEMARERERERKREEQRAREAERERERQEKQRQQQQQAAKKKKLPDDDFAALFASDDEDDGNGNGFDASADDAPPADNVSAKASLFGGGGVSSSSSSSSFSKSSGRGAGASKGARRSPSGGGGGSSGGSSGGMSLRDAVAAVKSDNSDTNWMLFSFDKSVDGVVFDSMGSGGHSEFLDHLHEAKAMYGLLRLLSGDRESRRVKFVFVTWVGSGVNGFVKAKSSTKKSSVTKEIGQFHVEIFAEDYDDLELATVQRKIKAAGGADYDQGNKGGYESKATSLKAKALENYRNKEKESNIKSIVFEKHALPSTTPCDLTGRPMVAPPSAAQAYINDTGNLDLGKHSSSRGGHDGGGDDWF